MNNQDKNPRVISKNYLRGINYIFIILSKMEQAELALVPLYSILAKSQILFPSLPLENHQKSMPDDS